MSVLVLPSWYGPGNNPPLPIVISPHGRGATGRSNAAFFDRLPAVGRFAVISPDGMGSRLRNFSYGAPGHIDDLAAVARAGIGRSALAPDRPHADLCAREQHGRTERRCCWSPGALICSPARPRSIPSPTSRGATASCRRCRARPPASRAGASRYGTVLQSTLEREVGGPPDGWQAPTPSAAPSTRPRRSRRRECRSSSGGAPKIGSSRIRSISPRRCSTHFASPRRVRRSAPPSADWAHSKEMRASALLPIVLSGFGLLPSDVRALPESVRHEGAPRCSDRSARSDHRHCGLELTLPSHAPSTIQRS